MRLGVYADLVYLREGEVLSTDLAFVLFVAGLASRVGELTVFGRLHPEPGRSRYELPREGVRFVPLPHYPRLTHLRGVTRAFRDSRTAFARELDRLDAVWLFGPHPLSLEFARIAHRRGKPVFLGVRQDFPHYIAGRLPGRGWAWAVPAAHALEAAFRRLARRHATVVVGEELARRYRRGAARVLATGFSLVGSQDVVTVANDSAPDKMSEADAIRVLSVGRLDPEKNPLLLPEILAILRRRDPRWRLRVVGDGPLERDLRRRAEELGVADALELVGYVPLGPELFAEYRAADAFLHVSLTEGLPQVLFEAQAAAIPIVATDVGGVRAALADGERGLLVAPENAEAAAAALERLRDEPELRRRLVRSGLAHAREETMDAQLDRVADFFRRNL